MLGLCRRSRFGCGMGERLLHPFPCQRLLILAAAHEKTAWSYPTQALDDSGHLKLCPPAKLVLTKAVAVEKVAQVHKFIPMELSCSALFTL